MYISMSLFHTVRLFFPNAVWNKINRLSHSEACIVFQNKVPALFNQTYFISPYFLLHGFDILNIFKTFSR